MRRLLRIFKRFALVVWAFLILASLILWIHSHFAGTLIRHMGPDVIPNTSTFIRSSTATLSLTRYHQTYKDPTIGGGRYPAGFTFEHWDSRAYPLLWPAGAPVNSLGFGAAHARLSEGDEYTLVLPYYAITTVLLLPLLWFVRFRRRAKSKTTPRCPACGYDLRATPDRCPECGRMADST